MLCITVVSGVLMGAVPGPDGCAPDSYIALSPVEFDHYMVSPFKLDVDEAGAICGAVLGVWALGFGIRAAIRALRDPGVAGVSDE